MANYCRNTVYFEGTIEALEKVQILFLEMKKKEYKTGYGQLPDFISEDYGYFFNIDLYGGELRYETKWSPNTELLMRIADEFNVSFVHEYEELGGSIYGTATYENNELTNIYLEEEDFEQYSYDEESDLYFFEGISYEIEYDILDTLLGRKINKLLK